MTEPGTARPLIALDYDGTIANTNFSKRMWIREHLDMDVPEWKCDRTNCVGIIGVDNYERMGEYVYGPEASRGAKPVAGSLRTIKQLSRLFDLAIVTARSEERIAYAREWLKTCSLSSHISDIIPRKGREKLDIARELGAGALLDDDVRHLKPSEDIPIVRYCLAPGKTMALTYEQGIIYVRTWSAFKKHVKTSLTGQYG